MDSNMNPFQGTENATMNLRHCQGSQAKNAWLFVEALESGAAVDSETANAFSFMAMPTTWKNACSRKQS